jgi:hypothetical protein
MGMDWMEVRRCKAGIESDDGRVVVVVAVMVSPVDADPLVATTARSDRVITGCRRFRA